MGNASGGGGQPIEESAEGVVQVIKDLNHDYSPAFLNWKGDPMDW